MERGRKLLAAKDYARATLEFRNAVQIAPQEAEAHYQLGLALLASGNIQNSYAALVRATELNPGHAAAQIKVSELLTTSRDPAVLKDAAQRLESVLASRPGDSDALTALAMTEMRMGDAKDAEAHLARALETGPANLRAAVGLARLRISQRDVAGAEQILSKVAAQKPPAAMPHVVLGQLYLAIGREAEARQEFQRALEIDGKMPASLLYLGYLHSRAGETAAAEAVYKRVSALPEKHYRSTHAVYLFETGRREEAVRELESLIAADPDDRTTRRFLISAYLRLRRNADADRLLTAALKRNPRDTDALLQRSATLLMAGKHDEAYGIVTQIVHLEPNLVAAHYLLSRIHGARGNLKSRQAELGETVRLNPQFLGARLEYARALLSSNAAAAGKLLEEAPAWQKQDAAFIAERNWVLGALGRKEELRRNVDLALARTPTADLMLQDAMLKMDTGNASGGRAALEAMMRRFPDDLRAIGLLAQSYAAQGEPEAAVRRVREFAAAHPKSAKAQHLLGVWLQRTGALEAASTAFRAAKAADSSFWQADVSLATVELAGRRTGSAKSLLEPLLMHPQAALPARSLLAMAHHDENPAASIEHYRKILELQPDNVLALNNLAYYLCEFANQPDEALRLAQRAKELAPDNPTVDDTLGWLLYKKGLHSRARPYLESAVKRQPNPARHAHLAMLYAAQGDSRRAMDQLSAAVKLGGASTPAVQAARNALVKIR